MYCVLRKIYNYLQPQILVCSTLTTSAFTFFFKEHTEKEKVSLVLRTYFSSLPNATCTAYQDVAKAKIR
ncbi:hypothetical protein GDO78_002895 [Eleutherodactylus coqui]|uniref:Uncharacterized protein n=1 Tax=Eleutherodactylus coqui TaxID=57060 RepID=A0A8J6EVC9_ELECQ|nr:hypothetical protein GDO78_002895 [Eleutherodactylus coqui]